MFKELYQKGVDYREFCHRASIIDTGDIHAIEDKIHLADDHIARIKKLKKDIYILAFAESWCIDCKIHIPLLEKYHTQNKKIHFSMVPKEGYEEYMEDYKEDGKCKIPTLIFMDEHFNIVAHWIEAPKKVKELRRANDPQHQRYLMGDMLDDSIEELIEILENVEGSH